MTIELKHDGSYEFCDKIPDVFVSNSDFMYLLKDQELRASIYNSLVSNEYSGLVGNLGYNKGEYFDSDPENEQYFNTYDKKRTYGFFAKC